MDDPIAEALDQLDVVEAAGMGVAGVEQQAHIAPRGVEQAGDLVEGRATIIR